MFLAKPGTLSYLINNLCNEVHVKMKTKTQDFEKMSWWALVKASLASDERDYTHIPLKQAVILLAIPMMLETSVEALFAITDIFFVAKLGSEAIATVGITEAVITLLYAVGIGLSMSITALVARRIGEGDVPRAAILAGQSILIGIALSIVIGICGVVYARDVLAFIGASDVILTRFSGYTAIMLGGSATILFLFIFNGIFRGAGEPVVAMRAIWIASAINIVLDPCLIFGLGPFPELGIEGAAIATTFGRGVGMCYAGYILFNGSARIQLNLHCLKPVMAELMLLLRISAGGIAQFFIATSSWLFLMKIMAEFGSAALAGYTIAIRVIDFIILPVWGLSNSVSTLVGQNLGASNIARAKQAVFYVAKYNVMLMLTIAVLFVVFADPLVGIFTDEQEVIAIGAKCLRILSYGFGLYAIGLVMIQAFNGAGDTFTPTWINGLCFWVFQIPFAYWFSMQIVMSPSGVFWAILIAESMMALIALTIFRRGKWTRTAV